jgi:2-polyprenyl-6-methoxyphenol hydroxylase-like FAD-dependent oxidoreductase
MDETRTERTTCCVVGAGPAGMMAGLLLARDGVDVTVLEKHADFFRDFRGDTVHPATLQILAELGIVDDFLSLPHTRMDRVTMETPSGPVTFADFTKVAPPFGFIAFVPQWDFLEFLHSQATRYPSFRLLRPAEAVDVIEREDQIIGVLASTPDGTVEVRADLVLAADGRHSVIRERAGLEVRASSPPIDVLWFRLSRRPEDEVPFFRRKDDNVLIAIDRGQYWQFAFVIPHEGYDSVRRRGLTSLRTAVAAVAPALADRVDEIADWEQVKLLSVRVDRLAQWYRPGLLCIGDAAHAMSPAGGVGINLAIQDAVAAARMLGPTFRSGGPTTDDLRRVQRRRELPTRITQAFQLKVLRDLYPRGRADDGPAPGRKDGDPVTFRLMRRFPPLRHMAGRFIGLGVRPEHVRTAGVGALR